MSADVRLTFNTYLAVNRVDERIASILMRHSDPRLTRQVYTDEKQLPIYESIKDLPSLSETKKYTHIYAQISGERGQNQSETVAKMIEKSVSQAVENALLSRGLSGCGRKCQMVGDEGLEPPTN